MAERANATAGKGHNSLAPDEFLTNYRAAVATKRALEEAQSAHQHALKKAKSAGINLDSFKAILKARKVEPEIVEQNLRDFARYARWLEMPIGTQPGLFEDATPVDDKAAAEQREWAADEAGYEAGKAGRNRSDFAFPAGSPLHARWDAGWMRGQAKLAEGLADGSAKARKGKRGRRGNAEDGSAA